MDNIILTIIIIIFFTVGVTMLLSPGKVKEYVSKGNLSALRDWGKSNDDAEEWVKNNIASKQVFRFIGFVMIIFSLLGIYAIIRTLLKS
jgi:hypothetical protein